MYITNGIHYRGLLQMYHGLKVDFLRMDYVRSESLLYIKIKTGVKLARLRGKL